VRLVLKAHGCVSDPTKIVLGRSSYFKARRGFPAFYEILDALFLTHTLLFIGCSLTDPDIQLVLENANIAAPSSYPHYALVERMRHRSIVHAIKSSHNIQLLEYSPGVHSEAVEALERLREQVESHRALPS
jgi:SIR2-like domain